MVVVVLSAEKKNPVGCSQRAVCGFFPRPLCTDQPAFLVLLWPREALLGGAASHAQHDLVLPVEDRLMPCLYFMLETAHRALYGHPARADAPRLECLVPELDLQLADL